MTTATLPERANQQVAFFTSDTFGPAHKKGHWYAKDDGTQAYRMERVAIFRSGEFRDSRGEQHQFDTVHMQMISSNFNLLRNGGHFPDPPIRCNHPGLFSGGGLDQVVGYVDTLVTEDITSPIDGETYTYVLASFDVLDEDAAKKIDSGLWRHRSAEIGWYETNQGMEFWPVLVGFAYVDIPAVEGLNGSFSKYANALPGVGERFVAVAGDKEDGLVADDNNTGGQGQGTSTHSAPAAPAAPAAPPAAPAPHVFKIGGKDSSDFAAVQAYIASLESQNSELQQFQAETREAGRNSFIDGLAAGPAPKIFASQVAGFKSLVKTMTDEQFGLFTASYADAPGQPALGQHFTSSEASGTSSNDGAEDPEVEKARRIYNRHQMSGMPADRLAETPSAKLLKSKGVI